MILQKEKLAQKPMVSSRLHEVEEYYFAKKLAEIERMKKQGKNIINLGIGSPDLPPHPLVIQTLFEEAQKPQQHGYQSYRGSIVLREAAAGWYQKWFDVKLDAASQIIPLMGSKEGIMHICMAFLNEGDGVLIPDPGYPTYRSAATIAGAKVHTYTLNESNGWQPDFKKLEEADLSGVKLMFVNYPQMPSGAKAQKETFRSLISFARKNHILIVHDNPYSFILNDEPLSILSFDPDMENVIELNSLSKSHNMAGWRVGLMLSSKSNLDQVMKFKSNMDSGMFLPVQLAAARALSLDADWFHSLNGIYSKRRKLVYNILDQLDVRYSKDQAGLFIWGKVSEKFESGFAMSDFVLNNCHVFITPGGIFGNEGNNYVRISLCASEEILEKAFEQIKQGLSNE